MASYYQDFFARQKQLGLGLNDFNQKEGAAGRPTYNPETDSLVTAAPDWRTIELDTIPYDAGRLEAAGSQKLNQAIAGLERLTGRTRQTQSPRNGVGFAGAPPAAERPRGVSFQDFAAQRDPNTSLSSDAKWASNFSRPQYWSDAFDKPRRGLQSVTPINGINPMMKRDPSVGLRMGEGSKTTNTPWGDITVTERKPAGIAPTIPTAASFASPSLPPVLEAPLPQFLGAPNGTSAANTFANIPARQAAIPPLMSAVLSSRETAATKSDMFGGIPRAMDANAAFDRGVSAIGRGLPMVAGFNAYSSALPGATSAAKETVSNAYETVRGVWPDALNPLKPKGSGLIRRY